MFSFLHEGRVLFSNKYTHLITEIARSLNTYTNEKIVRVIVSIVDNLKAEPKLVEELLCCGAIRKLNVLKQRTFKDTDITDSLCAVMDKLNADYDVLTSAELYVKEVESGELRNGPRHSQDFWKENARAFEKDDFRVVKQLIELLGSQDEETVCVACSDLGFFAAYYPDGKR